jgi:oligopeptide/dipeptide ABC transporter ATP-binding protein
MYLGRIMEIGPAEQVIRSPANPYTQALVSVSPSPDPPEAGTENRRTILVGETPDAVHIPTGCRFHPRCPYAFDRCRAEEPPLFDVGPGQQAACWLAEGGRTLPVLDRVPATAKDAVADAMPAGPAASAASAASAGSVTPAGPANGGS